MGFYKKGYRESKRKVIKEVHSEFKRRLAKIPVLTFIADKLAEEHESITPAIVLDEIDGNTFDDMTFDDLDIKLIIEEFMRIKSNEQRNND